jgi:poly [ADP-ribose] polymerase
MAMQKNTQPRGKAIECHKLVCAVGETNHNKFWNCWLYDSGDVEIEFGRIGVTSSKGVHIDAGRSFMEKKMSEKLRGKVNKETGELEPYSECRVIDGDFAATNNGAKTVAKCDLKKIATEQISHNSPETKKLIEWLAEVNRHQIHDATGGRVTWNADAGLFQTPLGIITPDSISEARTLLNTIADYVVKRNYDDRTFKKSVDNYLRLVPQNLGMRWSYDSFLPDVSALQNQNSILDNLDASYRSATTSPSTTKPSKETVAKVFETKLECVDNSREIDRINKFFTGSSNRVHQSYGMKIRQVWKIEIASELAAFVSVSNRTGNVRELWHGTKASNLLSILKGGLVIPPSSSSHVTGRMYGDGLYFSDQSTKALNYATGYWGGADPGRYFMFLANVAMGKEFVPTSNRYGYAGANSYPVRGFDSTFAKAGVSGVQNNEMIVYNTNQASLNFLIEFRR